MSIDSAGKGVYENYKEFPLEASPTLRGEYVPLKKIFEGMDSNRIEYVVEHVKPYVEKYREDREQISVSDYSKIEGAYLSEIKHALVSGLDVEMIKPKRRILKGIVIGALGYGIGIPLMLAFPAVLPFVLPDLMIGGIIAEETSRNIYYGWKSGKMIKKERTLIESMPIEKIACALEDICYYPAKTDEEKNALQLEEENKRNRVVRAFKRMKSKFVGKIFHKNSYISSPENFSELEEDVYRALNLPGSYK